MNDWLTVGARVASIRSDHHRKSVNLATVAKIGKRDVVLDNGERFNARSLSRSEGGTWGWRFTLVSADDPRVSELRAEIAQSRRVAEARAAVEKFRAREMDALDVIRALAPLTDFADEIAALIGEQPSNGGVS